MKKILFVCMGNICRSPTAEAVFRKQVTACGAAKQWEIDSAGTHAYHVGNSPDDRSQKCASKRGYNLSAITARQVKTEDFFTFDWVLAMDQQNLTQLKALRPPNAKATLELMLTFAANDAWHGDDVPDPYYGGIDGFDNVIDRIEDACEGFLKQLPV